MLRTLSLVPILQKSIASTLMVGQYTVAVQASCFILCITKWSWCSSRRLAGITTRERTV